jgi:hypothetical protein
MNMNNPGYNPRRGGEYLVVAIHLGYRQGTPTEFRNV